QFFTATANGQYAVVLSQGRCTDTSLCLTVTGINTGLDESSTTLMMASPVPFGDQLTLLLPVGLNTVITIMDVSGRTIVNDLNLVGGEKSSINTREWPQGIYMIRAVDGSIRMKVLKQ
ncbi:MAG: T9SS type A sorting domain-containing protein, partial [Bacteroidia bacterium]